MASGIFDRYPSLVPVFSYVCQKYFEGTAAEIKEYTIAVDVLGRSPEFDQKRDSIVRVRVHRLRERLSAYYREEGASNPIRIVIPSGQYVPHFIERALPEQEPVPEVRSNSASTARIPSGSKRF